MASKVAELKTRIRKYLRSGARVPARTEQHHFLTSTLNEEQPLFQYKNRIKNYLRSGARVPARTERFYCFFGILTEEQHLPENLPLLSLAAICHQSSDLNDDDLDIPAAFQIHANEQTRLIQFMRCRDDYSSLISQYHQQIDLHRASQNIPAPEIRFFKMRFKANYNHHLIQVLAQQFHFRCMLARQFYSHPVQQRHYRHRLIKETTRLLHSMAQDGVHGKQHIEQFWATCDALNQQTGLNTRISVSQTSKQYANVWLMLISLEIIFFLTCFWVFRAKG